MTIKPGAPSGALVVSIADLARLREVARKINALTTNPYWSSDRRWRIADLSREAIDILDRIEVHS
jgi:hypothetical protein